MATTSWAEMLLEREVIFAEDVRLYSASVRGLAALKRLWRKREKTLRLKAKATRLCPKAARLTTTP